MIIIYGKSSCSWCDKATALAEQYQLDFQYRSVDIEHYKEQLKSILPDVKTVPQIWWHGKHIGGYEDFASEIENTRSFGQEKA
jgi:glutaredoxin 1